METVEKIADDTMCAFENIYDSHYNYVMSILRKFCSNQSIEDVRQDTFVEVYRSLRGLRCPHRIRFWISKIASRAAMRHIRSKRRKKEYTHIEVTSDYNCAIDPFPVPERKVIAKDQLQALSERLTGREKELFQKALIEGLDSNQLGAEFGVTPSAIRGRLAVLKKKCCLIEAQ